MDRLLKRLKRLVGIKQLQHWFVAGTRETRKRDLKWRQVLRLDFLIICVISVLIGLWMKNRLRCLEHWGYTPYSYLDKIADGDEFDYVVVGAGAAGSAVAARLVLAGHQVLLVEAGGDPNLLTKIPGATFALTGSSLDWSYETIPNKKSCLASKEGRCRFIRGRCLGGSTSLNYMMYTRGNRQDYNFNVTGWTWNDIEPYFLRFEGLQEPYRLPKSSAQYHNTSGIMPIGYFGDSGNPWNTRIIEGLNSLNFPYNPDVNAKSQIGVSKILGFTSGGERVSTATAYLEEQGVKSKLKIAKNTRCTGIIIDSENVAKGITLSRGLTQTLKIYVKKEVVLSAGSISTPQLLMLSGIGLKEHLKEFNIPVKADLPVGQGMLDHVVPMIYIRVDYDSISLRNIMAIGSKLLQGMNWLITRRGPFSSNSVTDVTAFANTKCYDFKRRRLVNNRPECELPTLQLIYAFADKGSEYFVKSVYEVSMPYVSEVLEQFMTANKESSILVVLPVVLQPKSRGWLKLASTNPFIQPAITPNYLNDNRDVEEMVRAIRILEQVVETPVYKKYNASIMKLHLSGCPDMNNKGYWKCYARHMTHSAQHAVGTAALGQVVDERLRVKGIKNLRVGDASVLPNLPRSNIVAAVIAIGERLSDFLLQERSKK